MSRSWTAGPVLDRRPGPEFPVRSGPVIFPGPEFPVRSGPAIFPGPGFPVRSGPAIFPGPGFPVRSGPAIFSGLVRSGDQKPSKVAFQRFSWPKSESMRKMLPNAMVLASNGALWTPFRRVKNVRKLLKVSKTVQKSHKKDVSEAPMARIRICAKNAT